MATVHHLEIHRTARYFTLGATSPEPDEVWIVLHGYGQLAASFLDEFTGLDDGRRLVVAPEGLSRFYLDGMHEHRKVGASWMTREDRLVEIDDYLRYLDAVHDEALAGVARRPVRLHLLGFSQGAATATRWALRGKARVDRLILWSGLLPPEAMPQGAPGERGAGGADEDASARLRALTLVLVVGERDTVTSDSGLAEQRAALEAGGIPYRFVSFAGGHRLDRDTLRALADAGPGR